MDTLSRRYLTVAKALHIWQKRLTLRAERDGLVSGDPALLRVLSPATRAAVERDLRGLLAVLEKAGSLPVVQSGDTATVQVPGGHRVKLRREGALWSVEDFD